MHASVAHPPSEIGPDSLYTVAVPTDPSGLRGLAGVCQPLATPFCDPASVLAWSQSFLPARGWAPPVTWYVVARGDVTSAVMAFARQKAFGLSFHALAGYYWPYRSVAVIADQHMAPCMRAFVGHLTGSTSWSALRLGPLASNDVAAEALLSAFREAGWSCLRRDNGQTYELQLTGGVRPGSGSLQKNVAYSSRRLAREHGEVDVQRVVLGGGPSEVLATIRRAASIEQGSWVTHTADGEPKFVGEANERYWSLLAAAGPRQSEAVLWFLSVGGRPIAFSAHVETDRHIYIVANSYDEQFKIYSPGSIVASELLTDAVARGKTAIDWGQGDSGYKSRWGAVAGPVLYDVMLFRPGLPGRAKFFAARRVLRDWNVAE